MVLVMKYSVISLISVMHNVTSITRWQQVEALSDSFECIGAI